MPIDSGDYTYDNLFHPQPVREPWPDEAEKRIASLEETTGSTDWNLKALLARVEHLERVVHRLLNAGDSAEDDGR